MVNQKQLYVGPDGDAVEATPHEYVTRLKNQGYVRSEGEAETVEVTEVTPEVEHQVETPEATSVEDALDETTRRRRDR